jgi:hypothetical protein
MRRSLVAFLAAVTVALTGVPAATVPATHAFGPIIDGIGPPPPLRPPGLLAEHLAGDLAATAVSAIVPGSVDRTSLALHTTVTARLGFDDRSLRAEASLRVRNDSGAGVDRLELNTIAARLGSVTGLAAWVDGKTATVTRSDQTLIVRLGGVLPANASATVRIVYRATLRSGTSGSDWLFTRANGIAELYRWIPWISRVRQFDRPNHGDPFVTPVSPRVLLRLTTNRAMVVATPGRRVSVSGLTQVFEATNVRDLPIVVAPDFKTGSRMVGNTLVRAYVRPGWSSTPRLDVAVRAVERMIAKIGPYPYPSLIIAQTAGGFGMEGPGMIWIPGGVASGNLSYLITHETAHQWFYGLVGNDQANAPFTDEAAADFLARNVLGTRRSSGCSSADLDRTIYQYSSACYYEVVYIQGGNLIDDLRRRMGDSAFWKALRGYVTAQRWRLAPPTALLDALDAGTSLDFESTYRARFPRWY